MPYAPIRHKDFPCPWCGGELRFTFTGGISEIKGRHDCSYCGRRVNLASHKGIMRCSRYLRREKVFAVGVSGISEMKSDPETLDKIKEMLRCRTKRY